MTDRSPHSDGRTVEPQRAALVAERIRRWHGRGVSRAILALLVVPVFSRCGGGPPPAPAPITPPAPDSVAELLVPVDPTAALLAAEVNRARSVLADADGLLAKGEHERAAAAYEQVTLMHLSGDPEAVHELQVQALWGVAMANLLVTPNRLANRTATRNALQTVIATYDGTPWSVQARMMLGMLEEIDALRLQGSRSQEEIKRLNETIEQLRRVDLPRRPGGN